MLLCLTAMDERQEERQFSCLLNELEAVFDFINHIVVVGHTLVSVLLVEKGQVRTLPIEAFDGVSVAAVFEQLELEWKAALATPSPLNIPTDPQKVRWCREQLASYEQRIIQLELMITDINRLYQRAENALSLRSETSNNPYQPVLNRYESQLHQVHLLRKEVLELL